MITKERLKEILDKNGSVYTTETGNYESNYLELILYDSAKFTVKKNNTVRLFIADTIEWHWYKLENLFENEEDAEFVLKFKRIPKTEYLDLPTWEQFCNEDKIVTFTAYPYNYHLLKFGNYIRLKSFYERDVMDIFIKSLTKENYWEACELCRKLWLGEKE